MSSDADAKGSFCGFHLHYHADLDHLLLELVRPLLGGLVAERRIDRFFFVRYGLGGPHLRLRLRLCEGQGDTVHARVTEAAAEFFRRRPSTRSLRGEEILRVNQAILSTDPSEHDDAVYPDNSVRACPFLPETERYGGAALLPASLEYFGLSSVRALHFVAVHRGAPPARRLPLILRALFAEAVGLAAHGEELLALLASPFEGQRAAMNPFVERGDQLFSERKELFSRLLSEDLEALLEGSSPSSLAAFDLAEAARALAATLRPAPPAVRLRVAASQLHMSANRLGLRGPEEAYLGRVLWRTAQELRTRAPSLFDRLDLAALAPHVDAPEQLRELAGRAVIDLGF